jgi:hypothetical protein
MRREGLEIYKVPCLVRVEMGMEIEIDMHGRKRCKIKR